MATKKRPDTGHSAKTFSEWINNNAVRLKERLSLYGNFDEDAFQDAYLVIVTADEHESTSDYEATFLKAYRGIANKNRGDEFTDCHPDELFFTLLPADETDPEDDSDESDIIQKTIDTIRRHIQDTYSGTDVKVFDLKLAGYTLRDISATLGIGTAAINNVIKRISTETRCWFSKTTTKRNGYETV